MARSVGIWGPIYNNYTNIQQNFNGEFSTGILDHKVLIGGEHRYFTNNFDYVSGTMMDTIDVTQSFSPLTRSVVDSHYPHRLQWVSPDQYTISGYVTDVISLGRLSAMLSLRVDRFSRKAEGTIAAFEQTALAPKLGLVYQVIPERVSVFGNYMSGFQNVAPVNQPDGTQLIVDPIFALQSEGGVKADAFDGKLSATLSYYHIAIDNATRVGTDGFTVQDGEQLSKGFEVEMVTNPVPGLNIIAGYVYNDNRIVKASDESIEGNKATWAPENVANFWVSYTSQRFLKGLGLGVGANHVGKSFVFNDNEFYIPAYTIFNATVFYDQSNWRIGLKLNNLSNERYWDAYGNAQAPINFASNLTFRF